VPLLILAAFAGGCASPAASPADLLLLDPESPALRAMQTREFETRDEIELLSASAAVLQDLGFQVEESVHEVGYLRAAKERSAREYGQEIARIFLLLTGNQVPVDLQQKISAALVSRPVDESSSRHALRIMFYRVVWQGDGSRSRGQGQSEYIPPGIQRMEMIREPEIYQQFFGRLSKAVFLEPFKI
jgi:hypothetical protein